MPGSNTCSGTSRPSSGGPRWPTSTTPGGRELEADPQGKADGEGRAARGIIAGADRRFEVEGHLAVVEPNRSRDRLGDASDQLDPRQETDPRLEVAEAGLVHAQRADEDAGRSPQRQR